MYKTKERIGALIMALILVVAMIGSVAPKAEAITIDQFEDLNHHWSYKAVEWVIDHGYMVGVSSKRFDPNGTVTRAQVVQVLYNMGGSNKVNGGVNPYKDVAEKSWYRNSVVWAHKYGITDYILNDEFKPNVAATRQEIGYMFQKYAQEFDVTNKNAKFELDSKYVEVFPDRGFIGIAFHEAVIWTVQYGLMVGSGGKLYPIKSITRGELAQVIMRYFEVAERDDPDASPKPDESPNPDESPKPDGTPKPTEKPTPKPTAKPTPKPTPKPPVATPTPVPTPKPPVATPTPVPTPKPPVATPTPVPTPDPGDDKDPDPDNGNEEPGDDEDPDIDNGDEEPDKVSRAITEVTGLVKDFQNNS